MAWLIENSVLSTTDSRFSSSTVGVSGGSSPTSDEVAPTQPSPSSVAGGAFSSRKACAGCAASGASSSLLSPAVVGDFNTGLRLRVLCCDRYARLRAPRSRNQGPGAEQPRTRLRSPLAKARRPQVWAFPRVSASADQSENRCVRAEPLNYGDGRGSPERQTQSSAIKIILGTDAGAMPKCSAQG